MSCTGYRFGRRVAALAAEAALGAALCVIAAATALGGTGFTTVKDFTALYHNSSVGGLLLTTTPSTKSRATPG